MLESRVRLLTQNWVSMPFGQFMTDATDATGATDAFCAPTPAAGCAAAVRAAKHVSQWSQ